MKKRVLIAGLFHETHTFLEGTTGLRNFHITRGDDMLAAKGDSSPLGGVLELAEEYGWEVLPTVDYRAQPSATVEDEVIDAFWSDFQAQFAKVALASRSAVAEMPGPGPGIVDTAIERSTDSPKSQTSPAYNSGVAPRLSTALHDTAAPLVDAIYLVLHGAMTTQSIQDVEGELLQRIRSLPGLAEVPLFGVFDLHANFTPRMAELSNCLVGYRENPHTDAREAGCVAARLLHRCLTTGECPCQQIHITPIVWPPTGTATANQPMKALEQRAREHETKASVWSVNVVAGFAFADTQDTGVSFVGCGTDSEAVQGCLEDLAETAQRDRDFGNVTDPPLSEVMPKVIAPHEGLTVLVEPSDNIGGGAPGDGTGLLRALLEYEVPNSAICIADPKAVKACEAAGKGSKVTLSIGGKGSRLDAGPVDLEVEVIALNDGRFELEDKQSHLASMCGDHFDMGRCAVVRRRPASRDQNAESPNSGEFAYLTILLTSVKTPPFDLGQWRSQGIEPSQLSVIAVKAAVAHRRAYDPIAARMFWVDTPGPCSSNLKSFPYKHIRRPIYPLDS